VEVAFASVSVEAAATRAVENSLDVAECFVGDTKQTAQIIALALVFFSRDYFGVLASRINQTRNTLEVLFIERPRLTKVGIANADTHGLIPQMSHCWFMPAVNFGPANAAIPHILYVGRSLARRRGERYVRD
jgi:hypothetical protein